MATIWVTRPIDGRHDELKNKGVNARKLKRRKHETTERDDKLTLRQDEMTRLNDELRRSIGEMTRRHDGPTGWRVEMKFLSRS